MTYYTFADTPAGRLLLLSDGKNITGIHWEQFKRSPKLQAEWIENKAIFQTFLGEFKEYFKGKRKNFDIPFALQGTPFQIKVWRALLKIPFGHTSTYAEVARAIEHPRAVRAVGTAVGSNPLSIIIPCHRVLTSSGKLGGYNGGTETKQLLLSREGVMEHA